MPKPDMEIVKQIEADMQAVADKWHLELNRNQAVDGVITLNLGVRFTPTSDDGS